MIKANELRIGNYVTINNKSGWPEIKDKPVIITGISWKEDKDFPNSSHIMEVFNQKNYRLYSQFNEFIHPIQITEEWLLKFGITESELSNGSIIENWIGDKFTGYIMRKYTNSIVISTVHQWQNIHFALTGKELTFKDL